MYICSNSLNLACQELQKVENFGPQIGLRNDLWEHVIKKMSRVGGGGGEGGGRGVGGGWEGGGRGVGGGCHQSPLHSACLCS